MEDNYLIQSKIHTKAIVTIMEKVLKNKSADILDYYGLFFNWLSWSDLNDPMYENLSDPNKGEHLEVTLTKLRMSLSRSKRLTIPAIKTMITGVT